MKKKFFCVLLMVLLTLTMMPSMAFASQIDTGSDLEGTVYVTYSHDGQFAQGNTDSGFMNYVAVDIADIVDSEYYPGEFPYDADGDGVDDVTLLMLFRYVLDTYGQGSADLVVSGEGSGSAYMTGGTWHTEDGTPWDENLNYYYNGMYPLGAEGWGATCDQITVHDGDFADVMHYSSWSFWMDSNAGFQYFAGDDYIADFENGNVENADIDGPPGYVVHEFRGTAGEPMEAALVKAFGDLASGAGTSYAAFENTVYYGAELYEEEGRFEADEDGMFEMTFAEPGDYVIWTEGTEGDYGDVVNAPAFAKVHVEAAAPAVVTAKVDFTSQLSGAFLHAPQFGYEVSSDLAESYGFADDVEGVSALDVLVAAHELTFGEDFTKETATDYMKVSAFNVTKQFGVEDYYGGFFYNHGFPNDGTESTYGGYNGTVVGTQEVKDGDLVEFYFYEDEYYGDTYNWFTDADGEYSRTYNVEAGKDLELTLNGFYAMSAYLYKDEAEMVGADSVFGVEDAQIYTVDFETGALTPIEGAITDEDGAVTLNFAEPGIYTIAAYGTDDCEFTQLLTLTTVEAEPAKFPYGGENVNFIKADGSGFGMFTPQEGTTCELDESGENVVIHYVPKNKTVYAGFNWGSVKKTIYTIESADIDITVKANEDGTYDITLPKEYTGYAHPVAVVKKNFSNGSWTSADQYYLAIPEFIEEPEKFPYDGENVNFIKADGSGFGMFTPQEGTTCELDESGENVVIHYVPKNKTVYAGFNWGSVKKTIYTIESADIDITVKANEDGTYDITLPAEYAGYAHPVAVVKKNFSNGSWTSADQYYLAIPEFIEEPEKFPYDGEGVNFIKADGSGFGMFTPQEGTTCELDESGENVVIHYVPKNKTVYAGFNWGSVKKTIYTIESARPEITFNVNEDGTYDITLPAEYAGYAHPVAVVKKNFSNGSWTSADQYYLAIPSFKEEAELDGVYRIFGSGRYETSFKVADELKELLGVEKFDAVILAYGSNYPDALAGSYLSAVQDAPILLVNSQEARIAAAQEYINANLKEGGTVYMLGGTGVVPDAAVEGLTGFETVRLGGDNRYETNLKILEEAAKFDSSVDEVLVCTGSGFADSLSAAAVGKPIMLVGKTLRDDQKEYLAGFNGDVTLTAVGGTGAVSEDIMEAAAAYGTTDRVAGNNRYETSAAVGAKYFEEPKAAVLANGRNFPDGLCGGAVAYTLGGPLFLVTDANADYAANLAAAEDLHVGIVLGGTGLIADDTARTVFGLEADAEITVK